MTSNTSLPVCPVCNTGLSVDDTHCPECETDLQIFAAPAEIALDFFNEGLDLAKAGSRQAAMDKMRGAIAANAGLVDAYIVLGKLYAQAGTSVDLEQAVAWWQRAQGVPATAEQTRKLAHCIQAASDRVRVTREVEEANRRSRATALMGGAAGVAVVCGLVGFLLRPAALPGGGALRVGSGSRGAARSTAAASVVPAPNAVAAIDAALRRPDISVSRLGNRLVLKGTVQTQAEKEITLSAAAFAANVPDGTVDGSGLQVRKTRASVAAGRVEHMLRMVVNKLGPASVDPLRKAKITVAGGAAGAPLAVSGVCADSRAGAEVVRLVREVYPSAAPVDVSGLVVRHGEAAARTSDEAEPAPSEAAAAPRVRLASTNRRPARSGQGDQVYINLSTRTYTVQPGDTIYAITHKYGRDTGQWQELWQNNRTTLPKPNAISAGTVLKLPPGWKAPKQPGEEND